MYEVMSSCYRKLHKCFEVTAGLLNRIPVFCNRKSRVLNFPYYISVDTAFEKPFILMAIVYKPIPQASAFQLGRRVGAQLWAWEMYMKILILIFLSS